MMNVNNNYFSNEYFLSEERVFDFKDRMIQDLLRNILFKEIRSFVSRQEKDEFFCPEEMHRTGHYFSLAQNDPAKKELLDSLCLIQKKISQHTSKGPIKLLLKQIQDTAEVYRLSRTFKDSLELDGDNQLSFCSLKLNLGYNSVIGQEYGIKVTSRNRYEDEENFQDLYRFYLDDFLISQKNTHCLFSFDECSKAAEKNRYRRQEFRVKPSISNLLVFAESPPLMDELVFKRFSPQEELLAILTGLFQFSDLTSRNLFFKYSPIRNPESMIETLYEKYSATDFLIENELISFQQVIDLYFSGLINGNTHIQVYEKALRADGFSNESIFNGLLNDLPKINEILNDFHPLLIDTEFTLGESNYFQAVEYISKFGEKETKRILPLRNVFLESDWKNLNLKKETLDLLSRKLEDEAAVDWIDRQDSFVFQRLHQEDRIELKKMIEEIISKEEYSLSYNIKLDREYCYAELKEHFVQSLSTDKKHPIWRWLDEHFMSTFWTLQDERNISEDIDFRKRLATAIFPRISWKQKQAFVERITSLKKYLVAFKKLSDCPYEQRRTEALNFLSEQSHLLDSGSKKKYLDMLEEKNYLDIVYEQLIDECSPTLFNLFKVMYPTLADGYRLLELSTGHSSLAGISVGHLFVPFEKYVDLAFYQSPLESEEYCLSEILRKQLDEEKMPSFLTQEFVDQELCRSLGLTCSSKSVHGNNKSRCNIQ